MGALPDCSLVGFVRGCRGKNFHAVSHNVPFLDLAALHGPSRGPNQIDFRFRIIHRRTLSFRSIRAVFNHGG